MAAASSNHIIATIVFVIMGSMLLVYYLYHHRRPEQKRPSTSHKHWIGHPSAYSGDYESHSVSTTITGGATRAELGSGNGPGGGDFSGLGDSWYHLGGYGTGAIQVTTTITQHKDYYHSNIV